MGRGKDLRPREKKCACCKEHFIQMLKGQDKCVPCIMKNEPAKPTTDTERKDEPAWVDWFIYHWRCIRMAAESMKGGNEDGGTENVCKDDN